MTKTQWGTIFSIYTHLNVPKNSEVEVIYFVESVFVYLLFGRTEKNLNLATAFSSSVWQVITLVKFVSIPSRSLSEGNFLSR